VKAIILAAGKGKRMHSKLQKVLHPVLGKPMIQYVIDAVRGAGISDITVVIGQNADGLKEGLAEANEGLNFAVQDTPLGTGDAALAGSKFVKDGDSVLILCGDMPLTTEAFLRDFIEYYETSSSDAVVAAVYRPGEHDFGRVYEDAGIFREIVEQRDMKPDSLGTDWANTGFYLFNGAALCYGLSRMTNDNSQNEYYLTDVPKILRDDGRNVRVFHSRADFSVFTGINTQAQLADAVGLMRTRINTEHMARGVRFIDPSSVFIDDSVKIAGGAVIYPGVIMEGLCEIAEGAVIGPHSHMKNTVVGENATVRQSVTTDAKIGANSDIGPFAYLRPGTVIGKGCRIGNFVEIKNANLGDEVKMAHLAYIGDADVGNDVNIGCGAITVNYDGRKKHRTVIKDGAFVGSNVNLIAPVTVEEGGFAAAGSTITDTVPENSLAIARARQNNKIDWRKQKKP